MLLYLNLLWQIILKIKKKKKKTVLVTVNINKLYDTMHLWKKSIHILLQHSKNRVVASAVFLRRNKLFLR